MLDFSKVNYREDKGDFIICLGDKPLKTPGRQKLSAPTEKLAVAIVAEWQKLGKEVDWSKLPLSNHLSAVIDSKDSLGKWQDDLVSFSKNDLLCYFAASPKELRERQERCWLPLIEKMNTHLGIDLTTTQGIVPVKQSEDSIEKIRQDLLKHGQFEVFVMRSLAGALSSFVLAYAVTHGWVQANEAFTFSTIDESWQEEQWGSDEEAAIRRQAICNDVTAVCEFYNLLK